MKKKTILTAVAAAAIAVSAQAQARQELPANKAYVFSGAPAEVVDSTSSLTYQWYRDGQPIAGATGEDYLLLPHLAYGTNVEIKRGAVSNDCPGGITYTNAVNLSFGLFVGTVNWASCNVAAYQTFAARPDQYTQFYQWNRTIAWAVTGDVTNYPTTTITDASWIVNPCPTGWRLPTNAECQELVNIGSVWAEVNTRGNVVNGRFLGPNYQTCSLPNNMAGCIFLSASGTRGIQGVLISQGENGRYWSSTPFSNTTYPNERGYNIVFTETTIGANGNLDKNRAFNIRCVQ